MSGGAADFRQVMQFLILTESVRLCLLMGGYGIIVLEDSMNIDKTRQDKTRQDKTRQDKTK